VAARIRRLAYVMPWFAGGPAREHFDDAQHLHARRRRVAPSRSNRGRRQIVRRNAPKCSEDGGCFRKRIAC